MSAALDTNILLYSSDSSSPYHKDARAFLQQLATGSALFYVFWPVIMGYLRMATHPSIFRKPLDPKVASANVERLISLPHVRTGSEGDRFWDAWRATNEGISIRGNLVPDAHLISLMHEHGVGTIYSRDRGLRRFDGIRVIDPLGTS
ncbi:MAG: TA system VapC family ribonuclease toxin [Actinomycetota bacterium]